MDYKKGYLKYKKKYLQLKGGAMNVDQDRYNYVESVGWFDKYSSTKALPIHHPDHVPTGYFFTNAQLGQSAVTVAVSDPMPFADEYGNVIRMDQWEGNMPGWVPSIGQNGAQLAHIFNTITKENAKQQLIQMAMTCFSFIAHGKKSIHTTTAKQAAFQQNALKHAAALHNAALEKNDAAVDAAYKILQSIWQEANEKPLDGVNALQAALQQGNPAAPHLQSIQQAVANLQSIQQQAEVQKTAYYDHDPNAFNVAAENLKSILQQVASQQAADQQATAAQQAADQQATAALQAAAALQVALQQQNLAAFRQAAENLQSILQQAEAQKTAFKLGNPHAFQQAVENLQSIQQQAAAQQAADQQAIAQHAAALQEALQQAATSESWWRWFTEYMYNKYKINGETPTLNKDGSPSSMEKFIIEDHFNQISERITAESYNLSIEKVTDEMVKDYKFMVQYNKMEAYKAAVAKRSFAVFYDPNSSYQQTILSHKNNLQILMNAFKILGKDRYGPNFVLQPFLNGINSIIQHD